jgi:hypothetical protein
MRFYNPAGELDAEPLARTYGEDVAMALSALQCVLDGEHAVLTSCEVTSGRRLFQLLRAQGLSDAAGLHSLLGEAEIRRVLLEPNLRAAAEFAEALRRRLGPGQVVVNPAAFVAPGWRGNQYLAFWETLIRSRFAAVHFSPDWQYSNGCVFELAVAVDAELPAFDAAGAPLGLERGIDLAGAALAEVEALGLAGGGLREGRDRLLQLLQLRQGAGAVQLSR